MSDYRHGNVNTFTGVYYKLFKTREGLMTVVCLQNFDEPDYDHNRFVKNSDGDEHVFETEEMAIEKLNNWFKPEEIVSEYRFETTNQRICGIIRD